MKLRCLFGHDFKIISGHRTGKLCFSLDCARPEIEVTMECKHCNKQKTEMRMSAFETVELTPEVAKQIREYAG